MLFSKKYGLAVGCAFITLVLYVIYKHSLSLGHPTMRETHTSPIGMATELVHNYTRETIAQDRNTDSDKAMTELPWNSSISSTSSNGMQDSRYHLSNTSTSPAVTMLFWSGIYGTYPWVKKTRTVRCPEEWGGYECVRSSEKRYFKDSNAVIFHARAVNLVSSVREALTLTRPLNQRWVLLANGESPVNTPNLGFLNGLINWTSSCLADSDFIAGAFVEPGIYQDGFDSAKNYLENKTGMAAILVSHCTRERMKWVQKLQEYIDVDVYGQCGTLKCGSEEKCYEMLRKYRFYLSFENSLCKDYFTEKFYHNALQNEIVPIIITLPQWINTSSNYLRLPPGSFINALDFNTVKQLAEHMKTVGSSPRLYNEYFKWRANHTINVGYFNRVLCNICKRLHLDRHTVKSYHDIASWYSFKRSCKPYPVPQ